MAHQIEDTDTMAYRLSGGLTWHGLGRPVMDDATDMEFFAQSGLAGWDPVEMEAAVVGRRPYDTQAPDRILNGGDKYYQVRKAAGWKAIVRSDNGSVLAYATDDYHSVRNRRIWDFFRKFSDSGQMKLETAGSLCGGKKVWGLAKTQSSFTLPGTTDRTDLYALFSTGHQPGFATMAGLTAVRVVCHNTLDLARGMAGSGKGGDLDKTGEALGCGYFRLSHSAAWSAAQAKLAQGVVENGLAYLQAYEAQANRLYRARVEPVVQRAYLTELFEDVLVERVMAGKYGTVISTAITGDGDKAAAGRRVLDYLAMQDEASDPTRQQDAGKRVLDALTGALNKTEVYNDLRPTTRRLYEMVGHTPGADEVGGTLWDAYNTVTYWADHERGRRAGASVDSSLFGDSRNLKAEALRLAVDYAGRVGVVS